MKQQTPIVMRVSKASTPSLSSLEKCVERTVKLTSPATVMDAASHTGLEI